MKRDRNDVLRSITALLAEVNKVSADRQVNSKPILSSSSESGVGYVSKQQIHDVILAVEAALSSGQVGYQSLEQTVERAMNQTIQKWMEKELRAIVNDVVEQEVQKITLQRRVG